MVEAFSQRLHRRKRARCSSQAPLLSILLLGLLLCEVYGRPAQNDLDPTVKCYNISDPPRRSQPYFQPTHQDARRVATQIAELDTRRPPHRTSWAAKGDFPEGTIDFELPLVFDAGTCRAIIAMRPNQGRVFDTTFVEWFANGVPYIQRQCAEEGERNNLGGRRFFARHLMLIVVGRNAREDGPGVVVNGTDFGGWPGIGSGVAMAGLDADVGPVDSSVALKNSTEVNVPPYRPPHGEATYPGKAEREMH